MLRLLLVFMICWTNELCAQQYYSYSFSGTTGDFQELEAKILKIEGISSCKIRVKEEVSSGEILLELLPYTRQDDNKNPDPLIQLKRVITDAGLEPKDLTEIKH